MYKSISRISTMALVSLCLTGSAHAATPEEACEAGKNLAAGKYAACEAKAEKVKVLTNDLTKYGNALLKCEEKLQKAWSKLEEKALAKGTSCPSTGDLTNIGDYVDQCVASVAEAVSGGALPGGSCGGAGLYSIAIYQTASVEIGAFQIEVDYSATGGMFTGSGSAVLCDNTLGNLDAFNDIDHSQLNAAWITLGAEDGPHLLTICEFSAVSTPDPSDFVITIVDAADGDAFPVAASAAVTVAKKL